MTYWYHIPVLLGEAIAALQVHPGGRYIDCTVGEGGHALEIMRHCTPGGRLLAMDADPQAIWTAESRLRAFGPAVGLGNENFNRLGDICARYGFDPVDGVLFDLGLSSAQLLKTERGFSFQQDALLDMRFSPEQKRTAADIVNQYSENELAMIIWKYGEERKSRSIARQVVRNRPLRTTKELAQVVARAVGGEKKRIHPATRTFQALRIAVNQELENLNTALDQATGVLVPGGRLVAISFHSLEDRAVKEFIKLETRPCICPPQTPVCRCDHQPRLRRVNRKVIKPSADEVAANPRSRSARMRVAERINPN